MKPDVTQLLKCLESGDKRAGEQLLPMVYDELRRLAEHRLANELPGQTLQATALVHEAYIRLGGAEEKWDGRGHFFAAAAESMRPPSHNVSWSRAASTICLAFRPAACWLAELASPAANASDTARTTDG